MTCIVGLEHKGKVWIGGDSLGVSGLDISHRSDEKVFKNGEFVMGFTSSFRMGQILRYCLEPPEYEGGDLMEYMVKQFIPELRITFKEEGYSWEERGDNGGNFLVGFKGKLFNIEPDFQVGIPSDGFDSIGCGTYYALGSLYNNKTKQPRQRVIQALDTASYFSGGVGGEYTILSK